MTREEVIDELFFSLDFDTIYDWIMDDLGSLSDYELEKKYAEITGKIIEIEPEEF